MTLAHTKKTWTIRAPDDNKNIINVDRPLFSPLFSHLRYCCRCLSPHFFLLTKPTRVSMASLYRAPLSLSYAPLIERHSCYSSSRHCHLTHLPNTFFSHLHSQPRKLNCNTVQAHVSKVWGRPPDNTRKLNSSCFPYPTLFRRKM